MRYLLLCFFLHSTAADSARLKELISIEGVRENQLIGYGLVVGLNGTGDKRQTFFAAQTLTNILERMGVSVPATAIQVTNTAGVMVTATLPPFGQTGNRIDITVAAIGDARNLQGGLLLLTPLRGADGQMYAAAQGPVVTGGFVAGALGTSQTVNHPTTGRVPNGAIIERAAPSQTPGSRLRLQLKQSDFTTAARIAEAINKALGTESLIATAENAGVVSVTVPGRFAAKPVEFIAALEALPVEADRKARVAINERTGTISIGGDIRIAPVSVMHGNLTVQIETNFEVAQPQPLSAGETTVVPSVGMGVKEEKARNLSLKEGSTVEDLVRALSAIGSTPRDIIAILQSLKTAGALDAEVEVM